MNFQRFWAVFVCRNWEFLRDRSTLTWNLLFPILRNLLYLIASG